jgi:hypothetical protein
MIVADEANQYSGVRQSLHALLTKHMHFVSDKDCVEGTRHCHAHSSACV